MERRNIINQYTFTSVTLALIMLVFGEDMINMSESVMAT